jgi:transposase InsO family protein
VERDVLRSNDAARVDESRVEESDVEPPLSFVRLTGRGVGRPRTARTVRRDEAARPRRMSAPQRLLLLDTWMRSKLPATEFSALVGVATHTLYEWKRRFEERGPEGLRDRMGARRTGSRLPEAVRRAIVMMKRAHPDWGQDRIHDVLVRGEGFEASAGAIARVLGEEGYVVEAVPTRPHAPELKRIHTARPNRLWQTDLFTFLLRRENRRVHLVAFLDDHSRFVVGHGLHASASGALVREVLEAAIANYGAPEEVLTDNGTQYRTWRGVSEFTRLLDRRGIRHAVAAPRHPQTLGKTERFWGTLWRELLERAIFQGLEDARRRIGWFIDWYNFQRPHQGIDGMVPADRYFAAAPEVRTTLTARVAKNAEDLARNGVPRKPFYLTGRVGDEPFSLHAEGEKVVFLKGSEREEVDLSAPGRRTDREAADGLPEVVSTSARVPDASELDGGETERPPGTSPLDGVIEEPQRPGEDEEGEEGGVPCAR